MKTIFFWLVMVFVLSMTPTKSASTFQYADKIFHFFIYGITSALFFVYLVRVFRPLKALALAVLLATTYGALMEVAQGFTTYRTFSYEDMGANALGALVAGVVIYLRRAK